jgi:hypothetical protein
MDTVTQDETRQFMLSAAWEAGHASALRQCRPQIENLERRIEAQNQRIAALIAAVPRQRGPGE